MEGSGAEHKGPSPQGRTAPHPLIIRFGINDVILTGESQDSVFIIIIFFYCCFVFLIPFCLVEPYRLPVFRGFNSCADFPLNIRLQRHLLADGH